MMCFSPRARPLPPCRLPCARAHCVPSLHIGSLAADHYSTSYTSGSALLWFMGIAEILGFALLDPPQGFKCAWIGSVLVGAMLKIVGSSAKIMPH